MPILALLALIVAAVLLSILLLPVALVQRYRLGTARRRARRWIASLNVLGLLASSGVFLTTAALTSTWIPGAFTSTLAGFVTGTMLGLAGLALTRWERTPQAIYYTANRWLVLGITLIVAGRLLYGFWRGWQAWSAGLETATWAAASGVPGSLAAGAIVLGYYLAFWLGVERQSRMADRRLRIGD